MNVSKELFEQFISWLKQDGLIPKKSERLWKKTILTRLLYDDKKTLDNWEDFMLDHISKKAKRPINVNFDENYLIGIGVNISGVHKTIRNVVKGETMSRLFFEDGTNIDVDNTIPIQLLDAHARNQHGN